ncbi:MAG: SMP-30/gluconolactonase/LRE family protein [bacterium]|nr:SMP-30/gluconolactonase/LRE family protein [bacterium]MCP5041571.1 SMP-30/gluconolactonase/LRE family protein [bacterium]
MTGNRTLETLASGYGLIEGPRVDANDHLYFSDVLKGGVYRRAPDGTIDTVVAKRKGVGGIALHADGGIVISGRNLCHVDNGETRILFDLEDVPGFNDLFTNDEGAIFVGSMRTSPFEAGGERAPGEAYLVTAEGKGRELYGDISLTNGIGLSPDRRTLYHSDTIRNQVIVHDLDAEANASGRRPLGNTPDLHPDGLAVDEAGCVWVADYGGGCVQRLRPDGGLDLRLEIPAAQVTSVCFGGSDLRDLYVVSADNTNDPELGGSIFRTRVETPGLPVPLARI